MSKPKAGEPLCETCGRPRPVIMNATANVCPTCWQPFEERRAPNPNCPLCQGLGSWVEGQPCDCTKVASALAAPQPSDKDTAHAIVRMWLDLEDGTPQEQRDRLVEDISGALAQVRTEALATVSKEVGEAQAWGEHLGKHSAAKTALATDKVRETLMLAESYILGIEGDKDFVLKAICAALGKGA
jgi:hypothetical protein